MNTDFSINNDLIKNKVLFLDTPNPVKPIPEKKTKNFDSKEEASLDFIDDDEPVKPKKVIKKVNNEEVNGAKEKVKGAKEEVKCAKEEVKGAKEEVK
ncbi:MAG TPA: hypothetical protein DEF82_09995, partial [Crocinitomicaceae bacterium]|nr:hypothetical protein [Crocinitomicaceae bacterium]